MPKHKTTEKELTPVTESDVNLSKEALPIMYNTLEFYLTSPDEGKVLLCIRGDNVFNSMGRTVSLSNIEKETGLPSSTLKSGGKGILPRLIKKGLIKNRTYTYELTGLGRSVVEGYYAFVHTLLPELEGIKSKEPELKELRQTLFNKQNLKIMVKK